MQIDPDDYPRSMRDIAVRQRRRAMLDLPHMGPLVAYVEQLRSCGRGEVPLFDPLDGGVEAVVLFLFEKPGPMTADGAGSGFISQNNDDPTAEATYRFMRQAGIARKLTVAWNVVPWWNGTRKVTGAELRQGVASIEGLIELLPNLRVVLLIGTKAARAERLLKNTGLVLLCSDHPSPIVRAAYRERWDNIPCQWARVLAHLERLPPASARDEEDPGQRRA
jgi:hypothetical protein